MELIDFLNARLAEDEATDPNDFGTYSGTASQGRMLDEVHAKRELIRQHVDYYGDGPDDSWPVRVLSLLALPYAEHEDYREEWRPQ